MNGRQVMEGRKANMESRQKPVIGMKEFLACIFNINPKENNEMEIAITNNNNPYSPKKIQLLFPTGMVDMEKEALLKEIEKAIKKKQEGFNHYRRQLGNVELNDCIMWWEGVLEQEYAGYQGDW